MKKYAVDCLRLKNVYFNLFLLCLPIIIFNLPLIASGNKIIPGDPDWYFQIYEAFRKTVLIYHQFPDMNSWMAGGIPLFANVQLGLISVQAPLVLLFGSVLGLKVSVLAYHLIAFFGFRKLFKDGFGSSPLRATLLAYIPVFGSFFAYRVIAGHFTFLLAAFVPWLIYLYLKRADRRSWLWFGLIYSLMVWSSPHYTTIMTVVLIGAWFGCELIRHIWQAYRARKWQTFLQSLRVDLLFFGEALGLIIILCAYRMYFVATFIKDFPRTNPVGSDAFTGIWQGLYALWGPDQFYNPPTLTSGWGWAEASTYIGIGTLLCLLIVFGIFIKQLVQKKKPPFSYPIAILGALCILFFILGMGDFGTYSPYHLLGHLPVFNSMRVATRWLFWSSLIVLCILAAYKSRAYTKVINIILALTVVELFVTGFLIIGSAYTVRLVQERPVNAPFEQEAHYRVPRPEYINNEVFRKAYWYDENLVEATRNNIGQVIAGDSLVDTRQPGSTIRCGFSQGNCPFISYNAKVIRWSPNKIVIQRLAPGPIQMNMNPGRGWSVNGKYVFANYKIVDPLKTFTITDSSQNITLEYAPKFSPTWLLHQVGL